MEQYKKSIQENFEQTKKLQAVKYRKNCLNINMKTK